MKKLLSILLATATVFSTTAFASPAAEPIESADEISLEVGGGAISSKISDASLTAENALNPNYDDELGLKVMDFDFEDFPTGEFLSLKLSNGDAYISEQGSKQTLSIVNGEVGGKEGTFMRQDVQNESAWGAVVRLYTNNGKTRLTSGTGKYTAVFDTYHTVKTGTPKIYNYSADMKENNYTVAAAETWEKVTVPLTTGTGSFNSIMLAVINSSAETTVYYDNVQVYYMPSETADYSVTSIKFPTVSVYAPGGIETSFANAMKANPAAYFGEIVESCEINDTTITLTVNDEGTVTLPSVVNGTRTKLLNAAAVKVGADDGIDELAPLYGVKLINENFERFTEGETYNGANDTKIHGNRVYATEGGTISGLLVKDVEGVGSGKYVKLNIDGSTDYPVFRTVLDNAKDSSTGERVEDYVRVPAKFTASIRMYLVDDTFANEIATRPALRRTDGNFDSIDTTKFGAGEWNTLTKSYSQTDSTKTVRELIWIFQDAKKAVGTIYIDDIKLYYKPTAADAYTDISLDFPTITLTTEKGFEEGAAAAINANPAEYLSSAVKSVDFTDTQMIITLNEDEAANYSYITIPELVNGTKTATYPVTKIDLPDYYAPVYGLRNYLWNAGNKSTNNVAADGDISFEREDFDYARVLSTTNPTSTHYKRNTGDDFPYNTNYTYTYITKARYSGANNCMLRRIAWGADGWNIIDKGKQSEGIWHVLKFEDYELDADNLGDVNGLLPNIYIGKSANAAVVQIDVAYDGLYFRPKATSSDYTTKFSGNTVTVTYANGIDEDTAEALETYYGKYFGGNVTALTVDGNDVVMTLADGVTEITVPKLVNKDGSATYGEVTVNTAVAPTSLPKETSIRGTSPAGLRFKAAVKSEFMGNENLTEFGYIVARAEKLTESGIADLTIGIDQTKLKTIESPSYKVVDGAITVNKFDKGVDNTTFAAVLVNIPSTNYGDKFAVRPYVVYGGDYYYGDTMKASILEVAESLKDGATGDVLEVINKIINGEALDKYEG